MKKIKVFDWISQTWRSSKSFNTNRPSPPENLSEINQKLMDLIIEKDVLERKPSLTFADRERLGEIKKEMDRLANIDLGERYFETTYK